MNTVQNIIAFSYRLLKHQNGFNFQSPTTLSKCKSVKDVYVAKIQNKKKLNVRIEIKQSMLWFVLHCFIMRQRNFENNETSKPNR